MGVHFDGVLKAVLGRPGAPDAIRRGLTPGELVAISTYTSAPFSGDWTYRTINRAASMCTILNALRGGQQAQAERDRLDDITSLIDSGLAKLPDYAGAVRRGTTMLRVRKDDFTVGSVWSDDGYMSTSSASGFGGNHRFEISVKSGKMIKGISGHPKEEEVLMPRGTRFRIVAAEKKPGDILYIELEEI